MTESWRPIKGFSYEVSDRGRVRRTETRRVVKSYFVTNRNGDLYEKVHLYRQGVEYKPFVHRLVAQAFIPNPELKPEVDHDNQNTLDNGKKNLAWVTRQENEELKRFMRITA